ncbi:MAG: baseplate assembly protein [Methylomonas sp.]|nr:MAG: baseplate assembly protein [Methylomonas sp.]
MTAFTQIDLSKVPAPNIVEALNFEAIFADMLADLQIRDSAFDALVESDPAYKILEVAAYRELLIRQRVNDSARAVMLAQAVNSDLDNLAANFNVERLLISPADNNTIPPVLAVYEDDIAFKARVQLAFEGLTTAGPSGSYIYHGLSADGNVKDIGVEAVQFHMSGSTIVIDDDAHLASPEPGQVAITVLSRVGTGTADASLLAKVDAAVNDEKVRPLTDRVVIRSAQIVNYSVNATLYFYDGPSSASVLAASQTKLNGYIDGQRKIGYDITRAGIYAALFQPGVQNVIIASPATDVVIDNHQAGYCTGITLLNGGLGV